MPTVDRPYDIVLFGATGFAGRLTAEYLAHHAPVGLRWAIAGRSKDKLDAMRAELLAIDPLTDVAVAIADVGDDTSIRALAAATRVLVTTVGPYVLYGNGVVAACADAGTDYVDLT
ncbi:MAG TPA: saccharopine dehydrogenase NADP-binding domain-containing protein, partial [Jatrophihabitantaceae bacterium]